MQLRVALISEKSSPNALFAFAIKGTSPSPRGLIASLSLDVTLEPSMNNQAETLVCYSSTAR